MTEGEVDTAIQAEIDKIQSAVNAISALRNPEFADDPPYTQAWVVMAEWTNIELDRINHYGTTKIYPPGQLASTTRGLAHLLLH